MACPIREAYLGVITMIMIIITTTATISLIIMIIKLECERHYYWQASTSLEAHVRGLDSKEEVDSFQRLVEIEEVCTLYRL